MMAKLPKSVISGWFLRYQGKGPNGTMSTSRPLIVPFEYMEDNQSQSHISTSNFLLKLGVVSIESINLKITISATKLSLTY
jgi:hypothetical protein